MVSSGTAQQRVREFINDPAVANDMYIGLPWLWVDNEVRCGQCRTPAGNTGCMNNKIG